MRHLLLGALLLSCTTDTSGEDTADAGPPPTVTIVSPEEGQAFAWDDEITLDVQVRRGQEELPFRSVVWTVGDKTLNGDEADVKAAAIGPGEVEVSVELYVGQDRYTESVTITVDEEPVDTGDTGVDPGTRSYAGTMAAHVWYDGDFGSFDADCPGTVNVDITEEGVMGGTGYCLLDGEYDMYFTIEGTQGGGQINGALIGEVDGQEARTPFTGTGKAGETLQAAYDKTFNDSGESVRIAGTWTADPVAPPAKPR